jgi:hypothetical protein
MSKVFRPPNLDPATNVESVIGGRRYHCPDLTAVDDHIRDLQARILSTDSKSDMVGKFRDDIDALLEHRQFMTTMAC